MRVLVVAAVGWLGCTPAESDWRRRDDDPRCLAVKGCPVTRGIVACEPMPAGGELAELRGTLIAGELRCTQALCPNRCCNTCSGDEALATGDGLVVLTGDAMGARGDDSKMCLGTGTTNQPVVARGRLLIEHGQRKLVDATLCTP